MTGPGWAKIIGPHSLQGRHAARVGLRVPCMPKAFRIRHIATKA
ncbi:TreTu family toxin [Duganella sp. PWIR1]